MANRKTAKKHALQRLKSRQGISDRTEANILVEEALKNGVRVIDLPLNDEIAMTYIYKSNTWKRRARYYKDYIYIFSDDKILITAFKARKD